MLIAPHIGKNIKTHSSSRSRCILEVRLKVCLTDHVPMAIADCNIVLGILHFLVLLAEVTICEQSAGELPSM